MQQPAAGPAADHPSPPLFVGHSQQGDFCQKVVLAEFSAEEPVF
jgi:hypothetical protein